MPHDRNRPESLRRLEHALRKEIGRRLRAARHDRELTQTSLAQRAGLSYQMIQKYESGDSRLSVERLLLLAALLDIPMAVVLEGLEAEVRDVTRWMRWQHPWLDRS